MKSLSILIAATLLLGACSKSEPDTSTAKPASPASTADTVPGTANQAPAPPRATDGDDVHRRHMGTGMPSGMPMDMRDGGPNCCPDHPMPMPR